MPAAPVPLTSQPASCPPGHLLGCSFQGAQQPCRYITVWHSTRYLWDPEGAGHSNQSAIMPIKSTRLMLPLPCSKNHCCMILSTTLGTNCKESNVCSRCAEGNNLCMYSLLSFCAPSACSLNGCAAAIPCNQHIPISIVMLKKAVPRTQCTQLQPHCDNNMLA